STIRNPPSDTSSPCFHPSPETPPTTNPAPTNMPSKFPILPDIPNPAHPFGSLPFRHSSTRVLFRPARSPQTNCARAQTKPISRQVKFLRRQSPLCRKPVSAQPAFLTRTRPTNPPL